MIELSAEEKQAILMSDEFHKFFDRSTRLIERAMCEDYQRYTLPNQNKRSLGKLCLSQNYLFMLFDGIAFDSSNIF